MSPTSSPTTLSPTATTTFKGTIKAATSGRLSTTITVPGNYTHYYGVSLVYPAGSLSSDVEVEIELYDRTSHST
eukprot:CAMPEP_0175112308 /NCGR_PEP_ID=MMETSP0086_2-20121207/15400_1 /TAXON_ID=136419 /ORGANISM="Unknown Unknown, Strain D1" /LENGTH=73 /DNA_ID=CAMNT_0016391175 /DNA_START=9 /DNA_END=226 /DNA_ORIENTATION=+